MADVEFYEQNIDIVNRMPKKSSSVMAATLMKLNIARSERGAKVILILVALIFFTLSILFFFKSGQGQYERQVLFIDRAGATPINGF